MVKLSKASEVHAFFELKAEELEGATSEFLDIKAATKDFAGKARVVLSTLLKQNGEGVETYTDDRMAYRRAKSTLLGRQTPDGQEIPGVLAPKHQSIRALATTIDELVEKIADARRDYIIKKSKEIQAKREELDRKLIGEGKSSEASLTTLDDWKTGEFEAVGRERPKREARVTGVEASLSGGQNPDTGPIKGTGTGSHRKQKKVSRGAYPSVPEYLRQKEQNRASHLPTTPPLATNENQQTGTLLERAGRYLRSLIG